MAEVPARLQHFGPSSGRMIRGIGHMNGGGKAYVGKDAQP